MKTGSRIDQMATLVTGALRDTAPPEALARALEHHKALAPRDQRVLRLCRLRLLAESRVKPAPAPAVAPPPVVEAPPPPRPAPPRLSPDQARAMVTAAFSGFGDDDDEA